MSRPFRFGVNTTRLESRAGWQDCCRRLEAEGWSVVLVPDHLGTASTFAPLVSAADVTTTLRVGTLVVNNDFFHPLRLAQEAATVDLLTDGRLELGLGAGWNRSEYQLLDVRYDPAAARAARLRRAVSTMKSSWAGDRRLSDPGGSRAIRAVPRPAQRPHPPLLIGGHGDAVLTLAAQEADIVGLTGLTWAGASLVPSGGRVDALAERVDLVREQAGDRFGDLEISILVQVASVGRTAASVLPGVAAAFGMEIEAVRRSPLTLIGSVEEVTEKLLAMRESLGISYVVVLDSSIGDMEPVVAALAGR